MRAGNLSMVGERSPRLLSFELPSQGNSPCPETVKKGSRHMSEQGTKDEIEAVWQTAVAEKIVEKGGHYFLAVKDNQKYLHEALVDAFRFQPVSNEATEMEGDHGRVETRTCRIMPADRIEDRELVAKWPRLTTIVELISEVTQKKTLVQGLA